MLEIVDHGVGKPRDSRVELPAGGRNVFQSLLDCYGLDEPVPFRMSKGFVDVVEGQFFLLLPVVMMDSLQTGDITKEGGSCQAAEDDYGMPALEFFPKGKVTPLGVEYADVGHEAADLGHIFATTSTSAMGVAACAIRSSAVSTGNQAGSCSSSQLGWRETGSGVLISDASSRPNDRQTFPATGRR